MIISVLAEYEKPKTIGLLFFTLSKQLWLIICSCSSRNSLGIRILRNVWLGANFGLGCKVDMQESDP